MRKEIERCDREIAEIRARPEVQAGTAPAWLVTLGIADWECEKRMIEAEAAEAERAQLEEEFASGLKAPFPWFGGKSRVADIVWDYFGDVANYVEPFAGSLAVLLGRPTPPHTETVNDLDCYLANFWRALSINPEGVAEWADWPVNEADLHARHLWLVNQEEFREKMKTEPFYFNEAIAGWWVWGISQWIGSGWCSRPDWMGRTNAGRTSRGIHTDEYNQRPKLGTAGDGVNRKVLSQKRPTLQTARRGLGEKSPILGDEGKGVNRRHMDYDAKWKKRPILSSAGEGVHREHLTVPRQIPTLIDNGKGVHQNIPGAGRRMRHEKGQTGCGDERSAQLLNYMQALASRLRRVRVCCGDWKRVTGPSVTVKHGVCGIFLDPPYDMRVVSNKQSGGAAPTDGLYSTHDNDVSKEVREWAIANGANPLLRIALCGYHGEHDMPESWACVPWKAHGGYGAQRGNQAYENASRERIWFSPHCITEGPLFR